ncbi:MAG: GldG family protein [Thermoanaerobaculia bacterium]|nr:GldG family protein [Thermoanaerobaculia bacterium]
MPTPTKPTRRQLLFGSTLGAGVLLVGALLVLVNYLSARHYERFDWTATDLYTLSDKTENIVEDLDQEIEAVVFMSPEDELFVPTRELLNRYGAVSPQIRVRIVDPVKNRAEAERLAQEHEVDRAGVVFVAGDERRVVSTADLAEYDYSGMQAGRAPEMTGFRGEQQFTQAILELVEREKPKILFTTGHGEASLDGREPGGLQQLTELLGEDNFELEEWASLGAQTVPEGTDVVVVPGPRASFAPPELALFDEFLAGGGRMLILVDPDLDEEGAMAEEALVGWLEEYGIETPRAIVVDPAKLLPFFGAETIFVDSYGSHPITEALRQARLTTVFALSRPVRAVEGAEPAPTELVRTSPEGWGETNLENLEAVDQDEEDLAGPVPLGQALELPPPEDAGTGETGAEEDDRPGQEGETPVQEDSSARVVVLGDSDLITNAQLGTAGNATLVTNTLNWLVERESHLGIPPKEPEDVRLSLTPAQRRVFVWLVVLGLPAACAVVGIYVTLKRRR